MRVISQDGTIDIPYEDMVIVTTGRYIGAEIAGIRYSMATYSSDEKAEKVMTVLRCSYSDAVILQNIEIDESDVEELKDILKNCMCVRISGADPKVEVVRNTVFQFPEDDEVEV